MRHALLLSLLAAACASSREAEDPMAWKGYGTSSDYDVEEPLAFTEEPYGFTGDTPIAEIPVSSYRETWFAPDDAPASAECDWWEISNDLPVEVEATAPSTPTRSTTAATSSKTTPAASSSWATPRSPTSTWATA